MRKTILSVLLFLFYIKIIIWREIFVLDKDKRLLPLAHRVRPYKLEEIVGQDHLLKENAPFRILLDKGEVPSCILYGPPGVGKTTLAYAIAKHTNREILEVNAAVCGVSEIKKAIEKSINLKRLLGKQLILFVDEIYHFNKLQQDVLLPHVEKGDIILIGTTIDRPYFEINKALLSRLLVFRLEPLKTEDLLKILEKAILKDEILAETGIDITEETLNMIALTACGDARKGLNLLELCFKVAQHSDIKVITPQLLKEVYTEPVYRYDKSKDDHYDVISALIKSIRGSDPDASIYWLTRLVEAQEDLRFICRRLLILAAEDIGLADPMALVMAQSASYACDYVGYPEASIILAELVIYMALCPKSNSSYKALNRARDYLKKHGIQEVPSHLKSGGKGYIYPHDFLMHYVEQKYMSKKAKFYDPVRIGYERKMWERYKKMLEYWKKNFVHLKEENKNDRFKK